MWAFREDYNGQQRAATESKQSDVEKGPRQNYLPTLYKEIQFGCRQIERVGEGEDPRIRGLREVLLDSASDQRLDGDLMILPER